MKSKTTFWALPLLCLLCSCLSACQAGDIGSSSSSANATSTTNDGADCKKECTKAGEGFAVTLTCDGEIKDGPNYFLAENAPEECLPLLQEDGATEPTDSGDFTIQ